MTDIQIIVNSRSPYKENVVRSLPPFTNLQKLHVENQYGSETIDNHLKQIAVSALNLEVLQLRGNIQGEWLRTIHMNNLNELSMHTSRNVSIDGLTYFIREHPRLQVFSFTGLNDIVAIGSCLAENCKNLKKFCFEDINAQRPAEETIEGRLEMFKKGTNKDSLRRFDFVLCFKNFEIFQLTAVSLKYPVMHFTSKYVQRKAFENRC